MKILQLFLRRGLPAVAKGSLTTKTLSLKIRSGVPLEPTAFRPRYLSTHTQNNLINILAREEEEEKTSGNLEIPAELADLKSALEQNWKIVEDDAVTNLFLKDKKVQISFHCQDTVQEDVEYDDAEEDEEEPVAPVRFCVTTTKAGKTLIINCISEYGEAKVESVMITSSLPDSIHANQGNLPEKKQYQGPDFLELAEDLQEAFMNYLEDDCMVNSDVAAFVAMYTDYKEQTQYAQFLKDAQSIIA